MRNPFRRRPRAADGRMTLVEHLAELRYRLIVSLVAVAAGAVVAFMAYSSILEVLLDPYCEILPSGRDCNLVIRDPLEGFATRLRVAGWSGLVLASPVVLWQLWRFVTPGLNPKEKRYAVPFVLTSVVLFLAGGTLALATFPRALDFLVTVGGPDIDTLFSPAPYLRLVILMIVAFGLAFELPVVLVFLQLAGVVTSRRLASWRRYAIVTVFVVAAVITPSQDPWTLLAMALPMTLFYEGAILVGRLLKR
ncbi:MAG: twin-arginine translocase subunit TatC [Actinomycetota bacterium]|nr:twin-arginine translocase subunit TatC [Actinomycetota bacterium]